MRNKQITTLIADDDRVDRALLASTLRDVDIVPIEAENGRDAIKLFDEHQPDFIFLDILMPKMDGYEAAKIIRKKVNDRFVPIIFITGFDQQKKLLNCYSAGGNDAISKPFDSGILIGKIKAIKKIININRELMRQRDENLKMKQELMHEQMGAKKFFEKICQKRKLEKPYLNYYISSMSVFNGDSLLIHEAENGDITLMLGDFTGHGLVAAMGVIPLVDAFHELVEKKVAFPELIKKINKKLDAILPTGVFCAAALIKIEQQSNKIDIWNGGLPDVIQIDESGNVKNTFKSSDIALGVLSEKSFNPTIKTISRDLGDRFYLYSDGILEACDKNDEMFGRQRLMATFLNLKNNPEKCQHLIQAVLDFSQDKEQLDDMTLAELTVINPNG